MVVKYLPDWFPGAEFKETARFYKKTLFEAAETPYAFVKHQIADGSNEPSYSSRLIQEEEGNPSPEQEYITKWSAFSLYGGGVEPVSWDVSLFFFALLEEVWRVNGQTAECCYF